MNTILSYIFIGSLTTYPNISNANICNFVNEIQNKCTKIIIENKENNLQTVVNLVDQKGKIGDYTIEYKGTHFEVYIPNSGDIGSFDFKNLGDGLCIIGDAIKYKQNLITKLTFSKY